MTPPPVLPDIIDLQGVPCRWTVIYRHGRGTATAVEQGPDRLLVRGRTEVREASLRALKRWLGRVARIHLPQRLNAVASEAGIALHGVTIRDQRTRWGSCSARGAISLNQKLLFLPPDLVRYVIVHELGHLEELNHSPRFWAVVRAMEPRVDLLRARMRRAWSLIPAWTIWGG
jgi:predicted metal-dependent hydrolase